MWLQVEEALHQAAATVVAGIVRLVPGTLALLVALVVAALLGGLLAFGVRRALLGVRFDERMASWGWGDAPEAGVAKGPSYLISRMAGGLVIVLGFLVGISAFSPTLTTELTLRLFGSAINLVTAALVLFVGVLVARFVSRGVLISLVNMNVHQARLISLGVRWLIVIFATAMALDHVQIGGRIVELAFAILFGGIVLTLALAVGLNSRDLARWSLSKQEDEARKDAGVEHF